MSELALAAMLGGYIEAALSSTTITDESHEKFGYPLDYRGLYTAADVSPALLLAMRSDCAAFLLANAADIGENYERAGKDFWFARNDHQCGYTYSGFVYTDDGRDRMMASAKSAGPVTLIVGEDGLIHAS